MTAVLTYVLLAATVKEATVSINHSCLNSAGGSLAVHGRLAIYNGGYPNLRLWQIGTHHLYGIYGDFPDLQCERAGTCTGDDYKNLPANLQHVMDRTHDTYFFVYGDFQLRALRPFRAGSMQAACIVSAKNLDLVDPQ